MELLRFMRVKYAPFVSYNLPELVVTQYGLSAFIKNYIYKSYL